TMKLDYRKWSTEIQKLRMRMQNLENRFLHSAFAFWVLNFRGYRHLHSSPLLPRPLRVLPVRDLDEHRPAGRLHRRAPARDRTARGRRGGRHDLLGRGDAVADVAREPDARGRGVAVVVRDRA